MDTLISILEPAEQEFEELKDILDEYNKLSKYQAEIKLKRVQRRSELREKNRNLTATEKEIEKYYQNEENIRFNLKTQKKIDSLKEQLNDISIEQRENSTNLQETFSKLSVAKQAIESTHSSIEQAHDLEEKYKAYEYKNFDQLIDQLNLIFSKENYKYSDQIGLMLGSCS